MVIRYWHSADGETEGAVHAVVLGEHDDIIVVVVVVVMMMVVVVVV